MYLDNRSLLEVQAIARRLGELLVSGDVIMLTGDVGAGKTTFTKALAEGMGIQGPIQSPSFTVVNNYTRATDGLRLAHYDFYRLTEPGIMANELQDTLGQAVVVIEWGEIVQDVLPDDIVAIGIVTVDEDTRRLELRAGGKRSEQILKELKHDSTT